MTINTWHIYRGTGDPHDRIRDKDLFPSPPPWRNFNVPDDQLLPDIDDAVSEERRRPFQASDDGLEVDIVNTALLLRRPLLVTGPPGTGKSTLAYSVARELKLGKVLRWPITSRTTLQDALYHYDAIGRLQEANLLSRTHRQNEESGQGDTNEQPAVPDIGTYLRLGSLGTALLPRAYPRVLLIDEIDKSDIDLPNDLLNIFEEGEFEIPELARLSKHHKIVHVRPHDSDQEVPITEGKIQCKAFPFVVMTSNGERELPAPLLRRCIRLDIKELRRETLSKVVKQYFDLATDEQNNFADPNMNELLDAFIEKRQDGGYLATDQLLNAVYLTMQEIDMPNEQDDLNRILSTIWKHLDAMSTV